MSYKKIGEFEALPQIDLGMGMAVQVSRVGGIVLADKADHPRLLLAGVNSEALVSIYMLRWEAMNTFSDKHCVVEVLDARDQPPPLVLVYPRVAGQDNYLLYLRG